MHFTEKYPIFRSCNSNWRKKRRRKKYQNRRQIFYVPYKCPHISLSRDIRNRKRRVTRYVEEQKRLDKKNVFRTKGVFGSFFCIYARGTLGSLYFYRASDVTRYKPLVKRPNTITKSRITVYNQAKTQRRRGNTDTQRNPPRKETRIKEKKRSRMQ